MTKVLIVDDFPAFRSGVRLLIETAVDLTVVGEAESGEAAVAMAAELKPDVILMDLSLPGIEGIEATRRIRANDPTAVVLVLTAYSDRARTIEAIQAGAIGYLLKDVRPPLLLDAIRAASRGESPLDPRAAAALVKATVGTTPALSERELDVVRLVAEGLANKQIADRLAISEKTVKNHLTRAFSTLGVSGRTQAAIWAAQHGLIDV